MGELEFLIQRPLECIRNITVHKRNKVSHMIRSPTTVVMKSMIDRSVLSRDNLTRVHNVARIEGLLHKP